MQKALKYSLSGHQMHELTGLPIITYEQLTDFKTLDDAFQGHDGIIILIELRKNSGHWTACFKRSSNLVEFFDSYGLLVDRELKYIPKPFRIKSKQDEPYLSKLLRESPYKLSYNDHVLQAMLPGINTCGRHVCNRIKNKKLSPNLYSKLMHSVPGMTPDELVCELVPL